MVSYTQASRGRAQTPESGRSASVLRQEGEYWTIAHDGVVFRLRDTKGLHCLAYLLAHPDERFAAADLLVAPGQPAESGSDAERARSTVTKRIKASVQKIHDHHPALGRHLSRSIKTGQECAYLPDPDEVIAWQL